MHDEPRCLLELYLGTGRFFFLVARQASKILEPSGCNMLVHLRSDYFSGLRRLLFLFELSEASKSLTQDLLSANLQLLPKKRHDGIREQTVDESNEDRRHREEKCR